ncbi:reverse transcriptase domain-containing protein [Tanacetum coccineum]
MPPRMKTQSAGRQTVAPGGGRMGGRIGRGGGRTREPTGRVGGRTSDQGGRGGDQGIGVNGGDDEVPDFSTVIAQQLQDLLPTIIAQVGNHTSNIQGDVRSVNVGNGRNGCSYKEFMACNPKDYDRKGGAIVYTRWIEKMESVQDMTGYGANQKVKSITGSFIGKALTWWNTQVQTRGRKAAVGMTWEDFKDLMRKEFCPNNVMQKLETEFWCYAMVGAGHAAYTDRFHELASLAPQIHVMVAATEPTIIQSDVLKAGMLTDEAIKNGSLKKNTKKRKNSRELSRKENVRDDNKISRTGRVFATITNPVRKEYTSTTPKCTNCSFHHNPEMHCRKYTNCNHLGHFARDYRAGPRMVTPMSARNLTTTRGAFFECGGTDHYKAACPRSNRAPRPGGNRQKQPMAIEGGQGRGNNGNQAHPGDLGFSYEIEIASGQLVEINKVIRDCKLEIEGHTFDIDLILFGHESFDVIVGMDWLSRHKAKIVYHKKVVKIPLPHGKILRVLEEKPKEKVRYLMSAKTEEPKLKDIVVVRNFLEVFPDDLSGLPPS